MSSRISTDVNEYSSSVSSFNMPKASKIIQRKPAIAVVKLVDSYPVAIGDASYSWAATEVLRLPVTMSYRYYIEEDVPVPLLNPTLENIASTVNAVKNLPAQIKGRSRAALDRAGVPRF